MLLARRHGRSLFCKDNSTLLDSVLLVFGKDPTLDCTSGSHIGFHRIGFHVVSFSFSHLRASTNRPISRPEPVDRRLCQAPTIVPVSSLPTPALAGAGARACLVPQQRWSGAVAVLLNFSLLDSGVPPRGNHRSGLSVSFGNEGTSTNTGQVHVSFSSLPASC